MFSKHHCRLNLLTGMVYCVNSICRHGHHELGIRKVLLWVENGWAFDVSFEKNNIVNKEQEDNIHGPMV